MSDVPIARALILFDTGLNGSAPRAVVRPLGHSDYDRYERQSGACFAAWRQKDTQDLQLRLMIEAWHMTAFYAVPAQMVHEALLVIPEYRSMLADDCLPKRFYGERW